MLVWLAGSICLAIQGKALKKATSTCSKCGGETTVKPDPSGSQLTMSCQNDKCDCISNHPVRPSGLSLFNITQILITLLAGTLGYVIADTKQFDLLLKVIAVLVGVLLGAIITRFLIRLLVFVLLQAKIPVAWQKEIVAYLAPRNSIHEKQIEASI
jgi:uncharacterized membrane protein YeaQ/YmgE (transglycosylase-associated protein family)